MKLQPLQEEELFPEHSDPVVILRTGLSRMEDRLNRCAETVRFYGLDGPVPNAAGCLEAKVRALIITPDQGCCPEESLQWLGKGILEARALLARIEASPETAEPLLVSFLEEWGFPSENASEHTNRCLKQVIDGFCAALEGLEDGLTISGEQTIMRAERSGDPGSH